MAQPNGMPHGIPDYDEDLDENFTGPGLLGTYDGGEDDEEEVYLEGYDDEYWGRGQETSVEPNGEASGAVIPDSPVGMPMPQRGPAPGPPPDQLFPN